jgi:site-specific DNA-methyltransferase (adenine-specific)
MINQLIHGDCLDVLRTLPSASVDAVVTDPPYGLSFMGKRWDYDVPSVAIWEECLRVLKPGGHLLAFAGTRTQHRMAVRIEDAGFEIRDMIAWVYGSGFPKSLDVSKAIDKAAGAERDVAARQWAGWGTALKPALEPITVARKPLIGTVAENVLEHGTGALNVDGCRAGTEDMTAQFDREWKQDGTFGNGKRASQGKQCPPGRWPANLIHDGSEEVVALAGEQARFFYCAKTSKRDRGDGNNHPTVKPADLMRYLCRLVTPPGGVVLDPFMGSGSTGKAAMLENFRFIGIERELEYIEIAKRRMGVLLDDSLVL